MTPIPPPIEAPTIWTGGLNQDEWILTPQPDELDALEKTRQRLVAGGVSLAKAEGADFTDLAPLGRRLQRHLVSGPGFVVLRGWSAHRLPEDEAGLLYWGLASRLGVPQPQNLSNERLHTVASGVILPRGQVAPGGSTSNNDIALHTENARPPTPPRTLGLLCLRQAATGGESVLLSGHTLHNRLLELHPEDMPRLYQPFRFGRHDETYPDGRISDESPVFRSESGKVLVRYGRYWIGVAERTSGESLDAAGRRALKRVDVVLAMTELALTVRLEPGDALFVNNHVVFHGRRAFQDAEGTGGRRLLRVWVGGPGPEA